jgi:adenosylcobinamide-GDP ribazoletransferase
MLSSLRIAVQFLTRIPVTASFEDPSAPRRAALFFPLVGLGLGVLLWIVHALLGPFVPPLLERTLLLVAGIASTGALHLDAVSDTADGLLGGRDRESALRIMHDPRAGAFGVTAIVSLLLVKWSALASIADAALGAALLGAPAVGRSAMLLALLMPPARSTGFARLFSGIPPRAGVACAALFAGVLPLALLRGVGLAGALVGLALAGALVATAWRRLRGVTGDVCGAAGELAETGFFIGVAVGSAAT